MKTLALALIFLTIFQLCLGQEERPLSLALNNGGCGQCQIEACRTPSSFECLAGEIIKIFLAFLRLYFHRNKNNFHYNNKNEKPFSPPSSHAKASIRMKPLKERVIPRAGLALLPVIENYAIFALRICPLLILSTRDYNRKVNARHASYVV